MKKLFLMLILRAPTTLFAQKLGHPDSQALLRPLPEATAVQSKLEVKGKGYQKQTEDIRSKLQRRTETYDKSKSTTNATRQAETEKNLQDMYSRIQQTVQDNQKAFDEEQQKRLGPVLEKVRNAVAAVAKIGNYVYIMEKAAGQPLYINGALNKDITTKIKAQLTKMK